MQVHLFCWFAAFLARKKGKADREIEADSQEDSPYAEWIKT